MRLRDEGRWIAPEQDEDRHALGDRALELAALHLALLLRKMRAREARDDEVATERQGRELTRARDALGISSAGTFSPRTPRPPAFETAAASSCVAETPKPTLRIGASVPSTAQIGG